MNDLLIYLVDDDDDDRLLLREAFRQHPSACTIQEFEDGHYVIDHLGTATTDEFPNLMLLDLNMPRMNGFDTLKAIRENQSWKTIPVVILTTSDDPSDRQRSKELGADAYMVKPPNYAHLQDVINRGVAMAKTDAADDKA